MLLLLFSAISGWGAVAIDAQRFFDRSTAATSISCPGVTTTAGDELLLAFIATDAKNPGITVTSVSGANLTWVLVQRANAQRGTAEIWRAFAPAVLANVSVTANLSQSVGASLTVLSFTGTDLSGTNGSAAVGRSAGASAASGAPSASLITSRDGAWVFGVGNDWDKALARTPGSGQVLVHQYLATVGDTYWVQRQNSPTPLSGTQVFINDTAPTTDRYNLSVVEILPAAIPPGTLSFSGTITPNTLGSGTILTLSGGRSATATADNFGTYAFTGLVDGTYTVTPRKTGAVFSPANRQVTLAGTSLTGIDFTANAVPTWNLSGTVNPASLGSGTLLTLSGAASGTRTADSSGNYTFTGLPDGSYTITPTKTATVFSPVSTNVVISGTSPAPINFSASAAPIAANYPDLSVILQPGRTSISGTGSSRVFRYTHDTFNGGSGPLEIQPAYNAATGNYQGEQHIYSFSANRWTLVRTIPVAGAFIFHPEHGHFHFPFAIFGLYAKNPDGSIGAPVALSEKNGFCIGDSLLYDRTLPNAGAFGSWGSCADPLSLRGLSIGAVDEYDQTDPGQSIAIANLPDGNYWLRAIVDPDNFLAESNENNNETDIDLTITGTVVTEHQILTPVLPNLTAIALSSPAAGDVSGVVALTAATASTGGVQFLLDGLPFANPVANPPYSLNWNTTALPNGLHWIAAQTTDAAGRTNTSAVTIVKINNQSTTPPVVEISGPDAGATVSAVVTVGATATSQNGIPTVQFFVDGSALGSPVTAPPFLISWNSTLVTDGPHVLSATATDQAGLSGSSAPVSVTVDNSHPANLIGIDATVFRDTGDIMQTPAFSTRTSAELLVAFVAYDGPSSRAQTATVTGAGLTWQLAKRSNAQSGTSEIWVANSTAILTNVTVTSQPANSGYHGSLTVIAFTNASGAGTVGQASAPTGAPDIFLPGIAAGNWVFAVGNDWDRAVGRTVVPGQVLVHQRIDTQVGDTFWVQSTAAPSTASGLVDLRDSAPTNDQWNYAAVEIVATRQ